MPKLLLVDDDTSLVQLLGDYLTNAGYEVVTAGDGREALRQMYDNRPDLVILDVTMPRQDGWETLERIRELADVPVVMLTARSDEPDVLRGFSLGADDYVTKPFSFAQLVARVRAVLARAGRDEAGEVIRGGDLEVDPVTRRATRSGQVVELTPTEFRLLVALMRRPGQVLTPKEIVREVWGPQYVDEIGYVRRYVWHLRRKIEPDPDHPRYIHTERGFGYTFRVEDETSKDETA